MEGGQSRDFVVLRMALAVACAVLMALVAAPLALAGTPASDQYGSALPGGGGGGGSGSPSGSGSDSTGGETTIPVAGDSSSSESSSTETGGTGGSALSGGGKGTSSNAGSDGRSSHGGDQDKSAGKTGDTGNSSVSSHPASHSVPQIAADSAGNSWLPFFIGAMIALACAAAALIYRNRRRTV